MTGPSDISAEFPDLRGDVLVFIVAYEAEQHITAVLDRVPADLWNDDTIHFLIIDDASKDRSVEVASEWKAARKVRNLTVLRNPVNQGYGGNQKLGYRIAIDAGFKFTILLHGDGQYAPELLPRFIEAWREKDADVVLGSRMHSIKSARAGGMRWYKVAGNRFLTFTQNKLTGRKLSEYHTGYRGYSSRFLQSVPFEVNTNDFHFDTEILLQSFHVEANIQEFPIPTHYGDEVCRVDGFRYAKDVLLATLQYKLHQFGMLCSLRYRNLTPLRYRDKTQAVYTSHRMAIDALVHNREKPATVLDLGCGPGFVAEQCQQLGMDVTGVDAYEPLPERMNAFHRVDLERDVLPVDIFDYDAVLLLDVIEHLAQPEQFLLDLRNRSKPHDVVRKRPTLVLSTPNVAFVGIRINMLLGRFNYAERGILDITHKRLFTRSTLLRTLTDCGYVIDRAIGVPPPFEAVMPGKLGRFFGCISNLLARAWPSMFSFQTLVVCRPLPGIQQLIRQSAKSVVILPATEAA